MAKQLLLNEYWRKKGFAFLNYSYTKAGITAFQRDFGCSMIDGIYGEETDRYLSNAIMKIQSALGCKDVDGKAGDETISKCKEFQKSVGGIKVDGIAGPITRNRLNDRSYSWDDIKYFSKSEFTCKCGCGMNNIDLKLVKILDEIREHYGRPLIVTSGCRCRDWNRKNGGVEGSRHVLGKASDIYLNGVSAQSLLAYCQSYVNKGLARYTYTNNTNMNGVVHIDIN